MKNIKNTDPQMPESMDVVTPMAKAYMLSSWVNDDFQFGAPKMKKIGLQMATPSSNPTEKSRADLFDSSMTSCDGILEQTGVGHQQDDAERDHAIDDVQYRYL